MKKKRVSEFLTEDEAKALLRVPDRRSLQGKRDYALLLLMLSTGLRKAEVCGLKRESFGTYRNQAVVDVIGKGGKYRRVALNPDVVEAVNDYRKALNVLKPVVEHTKARGIQSGDKIAKVSVVGVGMRSHAGIASTMFRTLAEEGINIEMISTSEIKVSVVIDEKYTELAVRVLHKAFALDQPA